MRAAMIQEVYDVTLTGVAPAIRAGDRARILYHSDTSGNVGAPYLSIDGTFIVLEATETVNVDHAVVSMKVSNIDRQPVGAIEILLQAIQKLETHSLKPNIVQGAPTAYVYDREIAPGLPAEVPIEFTDSTLELNRCRLRLKTSPLRTTAVDALDVPPHRHLIGSFSNSTSGNATHSGILVDSGGGGFSNIGGNNALIGASSAVASGQEVWYSSDTQPNITSTIAFDIHDDAAYPGNITVHLRNADITQQLFGTASLAGDPAPSGLLADFNWTITSIDNNGFLGGAVGTPGDTLLNLPNGQTLCITRVFWSSGSEEPNRRPLLADDNNTTWDDWDTNVGQLTGSFYVWDGTTVHERTVASRDFVNDDSMGWTGIDRPSAIQVGSTIRILYANSGQSAVVRNYAQSSAMVTAINRVGDPGVLANLLTAQPGGLRQEHELEIRCGSGRGRVEVTIENWVTTQSILRRS